MTRRPASLSISEPHHKSMALLAAMLLLISESGPGRLHRGPNGQVDNKGRRVRKGWDSADQQIQYVTGCLAPHDAELRQMKKSLANQSNCVVNKKKPGQNSEYLLLLHVWKQRRNCCCAGNSGSQVTDYSNYLSYFCSTSFTFQLRLVCLGAGANSCILMHSQCNYS